MKLLRFEWKSLAKQKLYYFYLFSFFILAYITIDPLALGKNFAPLDEQHLLIRMVLEDSRQEQIENEYIKMELEENEETLQSLQLQNSGILLADAVQQLREKMDELEDQNARLESRLIKTLSPKEKKRLKEQETNLLARIENGNYTTGELLEMDTAEFQQLAVSFNEKELSQLLDNVNQILGGDSHFAVQSSVTGTNYRELCVELGGYNEDFGFIHKMDGSFEPLTHEEMVENYQEQLSNGGYIQFFVPFLCDKISVLLCLALIFLFMIFPLQNDGAMQELFYLKKISSFRLMINKYLSLLCMGIFPVICLAVFLDIKLNLQAIDFGFETDFVTLFVALGVTLLPEILCLTGINILASLLIHSPLVPVILQFLIFLTSVDVSYGDYQMWRPVLRFNLKANNDLFQAYLPAILKNRSWIAMVAVILFVLSVLVYDAQKYGKLVRCNHWLERLRMKGMEWIRAKIKQSDKISEEKKKQEFGRQTNIYRYLFQLGYGKAIAVCIVLDVLAVVFVGEMGTELLFQRFLPLNGIILFSYIGLAEEKGGCKALVMLKDRVHVEGWKMLLSCVYSLIFIWGIGTFLIWNEMHVRLFVTGVTLFLGLIYSLVSRTKYGAVGGMYASVFVYIMMAISIL